MKTPTRERDALRQLRRLVRRWRRRLAMRDERVAVGFTDAATDEDARGKQAYVAMDTAHAAHVIRVNRRQSPKHYEAAIVHELLHVKSGLLESGIDALAEPAQTVMRDAHHAALDAVARALTRDGKRSPWGHKTLLERAPWERK